MTTHRKNGSRQTTAYIAMSIAVVAVSFFGTWLLTTHGFSRDDFSNPAYFPRDEKDFLSRLKIETVLAKSQKALELDPTDLKALVSSGIAYYALGREHAVEALNRLEEAKNQGATDYRIFYYLGRLYAMVGLPQFAVLEYDRFLHHKPQDREVLLELGQLHYGLGFFNQSASFYEKLLKNQRSRKADPLVAENLALVYIQLKDWERAQGLLESLRKDEKNYSKETSFYLGEVYLELDRCEEAVKFYDEALQVIREPQRRIALYEGKLTCLEKLEGAEPSQLVGVAEELLQADPQNRFARRIIKKNKRIRDRS